MTTKPTKIPRHVAIIMDGNRRWARERKLPEVEGHRQGVKAIKPIIQRATDLGIEVITFWAFATKNFDRSPSFLADIMAVFRETLDNRQWFDELKQNGAQLNIIGNPKRFPKDIINKLGKYLQAGKLDQPKILVNFALEYEGRDEIIRAIHKAKQAELEGKINLNNITIEQFSNYLDTAGQPDPDLVIRTSGEQRLSGYLIWQIGADSELYFTDTYWPDFTVDKFNEALEDYAARERRFGK